MGVGSLVLSALVLILLGFATAVFDYRRQVRQAHRRTSGPGEAAATAAVTSSEPPG
jgi:hypothetical protein